MERHLLSPLESFRRELEGPCENERDGKSENEEQNHNPDRPNRNVEERKNLGGDLDQDPADDHIGDGDAVNVAPLQFPQEFAPVHVTSVLPGLVWRSELYRPAVGFKRLQFFVSAQTLRLL